MLESLSLVSDIAFVLAVLILSSFFFGYQTLLAAGFVSAVEKAKYDSIQDAIETSIDLYLHRVSCISEKKRFHSCIHPVPPVLEVTRFDDNISVSSRYLLIA